ncbi:uncharacterized protein LOC134280151 [Saccostrea cucullata]|uniref:uncharacterized protein LOC134280151 n=1 Tax=Saccostrea cuccullata TaxID=36930 RepID=UPI002ED237E1
MILQVFLMAFFAFECNGRVVRPHENCRDNVCYFEFNVDYKFTMMWYNYTDIKDPDYNPVVLRNGLLSRRITNSSCSDTFIPLTKEGWQSVHVLSLEIRLRDKAGDFKENVSPGDGNYRLALAFNGQIPGPDIVVYEDQIVSVLVHNLLEVEGVSIHWHGIKQRGTPFMDGADMISQCPILPKQTFEYRFVASPVGTHWYHSHTGSMRSDGLAGALIVLPRIRPSIKIPRQPMPDVDAEFSVVLMDWGSGSQTAKELIQADRGIFGMLEEYDGTCLPLLRHPDGSGKLFQLRTGLVNGRGRRYILNDPKMPEKPYLPLETFTVTQNRYYRFRVINAGFDASFEISIDDHMLDIVAFDGSDVAPFRTDFVTLSIGETCDFIIYTGRPLDNYYINFFTTTTIRGPGAGAEIVNRARTYCVLNYRGVDENQTPCQRQRACTQSSPCLAVNQVYGLYPSHVNIRNVPIASLKSTELSLARNPVPIVGPGDARQLFFLNFYLFGGRPLINGISFRKPTSALQTFPGLGAITPCGPETCTSRGCRCTHILKFELGNIIDIVFFTFSDVKVHHPIHLHGHHFHILKIGYPVYDPETGNAIARNPDIRCLNQLCTEATWADPSWNTGNIPGLNLVDPPLKDTIIVPVNGYVIVRLRADNPGFWFMHCHLTHHQEEGMSLVVQEGDISDMPPVPPNFPTCNNFRFNPEQWLTSLNKQEAKLLAKGIKPSYRSGAVTQRSSFKDSPLCNMYPDLCKRPVY